MATNSISVPAVQAETSVKLRPAWLDTWHRFARNRPALLGLVIIVLLLFTAIFAPLLAPYDTAKNDLDHVVEAPSAAHLLGTDTLGRDMLSRMIWGARSVVVVMVVVSVISLGLGLTFGLVAGYFGGWSDTIISRIIDFLFAFPELLFIFFIAATIKPGLVSGLKQLALQNNLPWLDAFVRSGYADYLVVIIALSVLGWGYYARLIRGQILSLREKEFVISARAVGVPTWRIMTRYLLPNSLAPILIAVSLGLGGLALAEGILAYLGIGLQPPNPSWGNIIADNAPIYWRQWPQMIWMLLIPLVIISAVIFSFNYVGDGLNEALNPELS